MGEMDWPVVRGDYTVYDPDFSAAVVFLGNHDWNIPEFKNKVAISGKLITPQGIERIVLNTITNPKIRDFFLVGEDIAPFFPKDALISLYEDGMSDENKIKGTKAKINRLTNLKSEHIKEFQSQVQSMVEVNSYDKLENALEEYDQKDSYSSDLDLEEMDYSIEPSVPQIPRTKSGYYIEARNIQEAWKKTLKAIWNDGKELESQEGITKEILNLTVHIRNPLQNDIKGYPLGEEELENYAESLVHPRLGEDAEYTYGLRLRVRGDQMIDQVKQVIERLGEFPNTRRAVAVLWIPEIDGKKESGQPCLISVDFKIRDGKLHLSAVMRSNDMYGAVPSNWYGLARLGKHVSEKVGVEPGTLTTLSHSAHIYSSDYSSVKEIAGEEESKVKGFLEDNLGYFLIEVDKDKDIIKASFYDSDGGLCKTIEGKNATELRKRIINKEIVSLKEHAAYLGEQLAKAEQALKNNNEFKQDRA